MTRFHKTLCLALTLLLALAPCLSAQAYRPDTLHSGSRGEAVKILQQALIQLGYLGGTADGIFGTNTENAVKKFQRASGLTSDGLAGTKTQELLFQKAAASSGKSASATSASTSSTASTQQSTTASTSVSSTSGAALFGGNYATIRMGDSGARVKLLQQQLISMGYLSGKADGKFGKLTYAAVVAYQRANRLTADGLAGKKTLQSMESSAKITASASSTASKTTSTSTSSSASTSTAAKSTTSSTAAPSSSLTASGPSGASVKLLHWYNDVKPTLRSGSTLQIYDPSSGQSWNLRVYSCGRHCDAEPLTAEDTASMLKAFGGVNTWSQRAVFVKLPSGTWTIGATHDMPHMSGTISTNNFDGHLCVHFLRTMSEAEEKDPKYGVANQNTIRAFWKQLTGEEITN